MAAQPVNRRPARRVMTGRMSMATVGMIAERFARVINTPRRARAGRVGNGRIRSRGTNLPQAKGPEPRVSLSMTWLVHGPPAPRLHPPCGQRLSELAGLDISRMHGGV